MRVRSGSEQDNTAVILQVIISQNPPSPQDGTQVVKLRQTALGTGSNTAGITQYVKQSLGPGTPEDTEEGDSEPDAPADNAHHRSKKATRQFISQADLGQGTTTPPVLQFLRQRERKALTPDTTNQRSKHSILRPASASAVKTILAVTRCPAGHLSTRMRISAF